MDLGSIQNKKLLQSAPQQVVAKKQGRPSAKQPNTKYIKVSVDLPEDVVYQMKEALLRKFRGRYRTQTELIHVAVEKFLHDE